MVVETEKSTLEELRAFLAERWQFCYDHGTFPRRYMTGWKMERVGYFCVYADSPSEAVEKAMQCIRQTSCYPND